MHSGTDQFHGARMYEPGPGKSIHNPGKRGAPPLAPRPGLWTKPVVSSGPRSSVLAEGSVLRERKGQPPWFESLLPLSSSCSRRGLLPPALGITDDQASIWNSYADAARAKQQGMQSARDAMMRTMQSAR